MFPISYIKEVIIPKTNVRLGEPMNYAEFLMFIGLWFLFVTVQGCHVRDFWSLKPEDRFRGAPFRVYDLMDRSRFKAILWSLTYVSLPDEDTNSNKFKHVRTLIKQWNQNMTTNFTSSWIICLDESMSPWTNCWTCPGYMYVPRKPHPFGNEYHP